MSQRGLAALALLAGLGLSAGCSFFNNCDRPGLLTRLRGPCNGTPCNGDGCGPGMDFGPVMSGPIVTGPVVTGPALPPAGAEGGFTVPPNPALLPVPTQTIPPLGGLPATPVPAVPSKTGKDTSKTASQRGS